MLFPLLCSAVPALADSDTTRIEIPGQSVLVSVEIPALALDPESLDPGRVLLSGSTESGCIVAILYEENFPFVSSHDAFRRFASNRRVQVFTVDDVTCCEFKTEIRDEVVETTFHAWPVTADYFIDIHVACVVPKEELGRTQGFTRTDFASIVRSFRVEGRPDAARLRFPEEVYGIRDEDAAEETDGLGWATKQCTLRSGEWTAHFYLGMLALEHEKRDVAFEGFRKGAALLEAIPGRSPKHTLAMMFALDRAISIRTAEDAYDAVVPLCEQSVRVSMGVDDPQVQGFREESLFNLAVAYAKTSRQRKALETLRLVLDARPDFKGRAARSEELEPLRTLPEFRELVGD